MKLFDFGRREREATRQQQSEDWKKLEKDQKFMTALAEQDWFDPEHFDPENEADVERAVEFNDAFSVKEKVRTSLEQVYIQELKQKGLDLSGQDLQEVRDDLDTYLKLVLKETPEELTELNDHINEWVKTRGEIQRQQKELERLDKEGGLAGLQIKESELSSVREAGWEMKGFKIRRTKESGNEALERHGIKRERLQEELEKCREKVQKGENAESEIARLREQIAESRRYIFQDIAVAKSVQTKAQNLFTERAMKLASGVDDSHRDKTLEQVEKDYSAYNKTLEEDDDTGMDVVGDENREYGLDQRHGNFDQLIETRLTQRFAELIDKQQSKGQTTPDKIGLALRDYLRKEKLGNKDRDGIKETARRAVEAAKTTHANDKLMQYSLNQLLRSHWLE